MKRFKKNLLIATIFIILLSFCGIIIIICLNHFIKSFELFNWLSLLISIIALSISILSAFYSQYCQQNNNYKNFCINVLEQKRNDLNKQLNDIIESIKEHKDFDATIFTDTILTSCIFQNIFQKYYYKIDENISKYKNLLNFQQTNNDGKIFDILVNIKQLRIFLIEEINKEILDIYQGANNLPH